MNSFIYIDGILLLVTTFLFLILILSAVVIACSNIRLENDKDRLQTENQKLKSELSVTLDKLYREKFKVPEVDGDYQDVMNKSELGGEGNV